MKKSIDDYRHFVCIVAGNNPEELIKPYSKHNKVPYYVKYKYEDREKLLKNDIRLTEALVKQYPDDGDYLDRLEELKGLTPEEYFENLSEHQTVDKVTKDILTDENTNGKWSYYRLGGDYSIDFILKDGNTSKQSKKQDIDWEKTLDGNSLLYEITYDLVMNGRKPENEYEENIYNNMKDKTEYFKKFGDRETYVTSCSAFWAYAFVSEMTGWMELEDDKNQYVWMKKYYDVFLKNLPDDILLTIYECGK